MPYDYDAFLSYNSKDRDIVEAIAVRLADQGVRIFLDQWCLIPGDPWQEEIEAALDRSATSIVFLGPHGPSPWAHVEMRAALELRNSARMLRVIPTLLPGSNERSSERLPLFLRAFTWVDYTKGLQDERAFDALMAGIYGHSPGPPSTERKVSASGTLGTFFADSLLPVSQFQERPELEVMRLFWIDQQHSGVLSLIGIGGSGKTALACRFLQELPGSGLETREVVTNESLPLLQGLFAWSFYDRPNVELFFQSLYTFITNESLPDSPARDLSYRVVRFLEGARPQRVLLVLDGLEIVQEDRKSIAGFGLLRDSSLRHFVRRIAQSDLGIYMLVTSRFPLPDLLAFQGSGYTLLETDNLDEHTARRLLRARGVLGSDATLDRLLGHYGCHALTLDHLGTLLRDFFQGDASQASKLPPMGMAQGDAYAEYQAERLARIFAFYEERMPSAELDVLKALCVFRLPVSVDILARVFAKAGDERVASIPRLTEVETRSLLLRLKSRRLLSLTLGADNTTCVVHPAVRDYFYRAMGDARGRIHAEVGIELIRLSERSHGTKRPRDPEALDLLEEFLYHTVRAGDLMGGLRIYDNIIGGYRWLSWRLADYHRGIRITSLLVDAGATGQRGEPYPSPEYDQALLRLDLGQPVLAEQEMRRLLSQGRADLREADIGRLKPSSFSTYYELPPLLSICDALLLQGRFPEAEALASEMLNREDRDFWKSTSQTLIWIGSGPLGRRAIARFQRGTVRASLKDFKEAGRLALGRSAHDLRGEGWGAAGVHKVAFRGYHTAHHAAALLRIGKTRGAVRILERASRDLTWDHCPMVAAQCQLVRAEIASGIGATAEAMESIESVLAWSSGSDHQETLVRAGLAKARILMREKDSRGAQVQLKQVEEVARKSSFRALLADVLVVSGHLTLNTGSPEAARLLANEALDLSSRSDCAYLWAQADAWHLSGQVDLQMEEYDRAAGCASRAIDLRRSIGDPRLANTLLLYRRAEKQMKA